LCLLGVFMKPSLETSVATSNANSQIGLRVFWESTPNPASLKFLFSSSESTPPTAGTEQQGWNFTSALAAERSPLAAKIFGFPWTSGVYLGPDFVTVTKQDWVDWDVLAEPLAGLIAEHLNSGEPLLLLDAFSTDDTAGILESDSDIVKQIKQVLNREIRPVVALDGGDILFAKYENHILSVELRGSCSGCPSSMATLKQGVETRLRELFPEIQEVVAL
jgi:Fe-S cluster biogenesis protein NfuA